MMYGICVYIYLFIYLFIYVFIWSTSILCIYIYIYLFIYLYYDNINICSYLQVLESTATCRFCGFSPKAACKTCCAGTTAAMAARSRGFQNATCYSPSKCQEKKQGGQGILSSFESRHVTPEENFFFLLNSWGATATRTASTRVSCGMLLKACGEVNTILAVREWTQVASEGCLKTLTHIFELNINWQTQLDHRQTHIISLIN